MSEPLLLMPFLDESETFVLGFECGQTWQRVQDGETFEGTLIHTKNVEQIKMICNTFLCNYVIEKLCENWSVLNVKSQL